MQISIILNFKFFYFLGSILSSTYSDNVVNDDENEIIDENDEEVDESIDEITADEPETSSMKSKKPKNEAKQEVIDEITVSSDDDEVIIVEEPKKPKIEKRKSDKSTETKEKRPKIEDPKQLETQIWNVEEEDQEEVVLSSSDEIEEEYNPNDEEEINFLNLEMPLKKAKEVFKAGTGFSETTEAMGKLKCKELKINRKFEVSLLNHFYFS